MPLSHWSTTAAAVHIFERIKQIEMDETKGGRDVRREDEEKEERRKTMRG
jgi:hypothetical protein